MIIMISLFIPWSTKNFLLRNFYTNLHQSAFIYLIVIHIIQKFTEVFYFSTFHPHLFFKNFTMDNNQWRRFFTNQNHAAFTNEQERLRQQLTEVLDTLGAYFTEVRWLQVELTSQLSSSEFNIGWWQARYTCGTISPIAKWRSYRMRINFRSIR